MLFSAGLALALGHLAQAIPTPASTSDSSILLITRPSPAHNPPSCLRSIGSYGSVSTTDHIYIASNECVNEGLTALTDSIEDDGAMHFIPLGDMIKESSGWKEGTRLFWLGEAGVEGKIRIEGESGEFGNVLRDVMDKAGEWAEENGWTRQSPLQKVLGGQQGVKPHFERFFESHSSIIFSAPPEVHPILDTLIPSHLVLVALPENLSTSLSSSPPTPPKEILSNLANLTANLNFDATIDKILTEGLSERQLVRDIRYLTGESSELVSRHSFTSGARAAADWIRNKVQSTGAECHLSPFLPGFSPNVICTYPPLNLNLTSLTILSAHYDSRGSFGRIRAPGGDDDGSGTGHLLGIAQAIGKMGVRFREGPVVLAFFAGEEQGLLGSHAYAKELAEQNATVLLQIQADMLGYRAPDEPRQLGLPATIETAEASWLVGNLSNIYSPELIVGRTAACCSDHQSFLSYGFPATQVFERNDWIADPEYHSSGDVSLRDNYDFDQISAISRVVFASLLTVAGYEIDE